MLEVLSDRLIVKILVNDKTKGGIFLPASAQSEAKGIDLKKGKVVQVGPGRMHSTG